MHDRIETLKQAIKHLEHKATKLQSRLNSSISISNKVDENIRHLQQKLSAYEKDLTRLKNEIPNNTLDKYTHTEIDVTSLEELRLLATNINEIFHDLEDAKLVLRRPSIPNNSLINLKETYQMLIKQYDIQVDTTNIKYSEHFNFIKNCRALRLYITDLITTLYNLKKQPISTVNEIRQLINEKSSELANLMRIYDNLQPLLLNAEKETSESGKIKLNEENNFLKRALQSVEVYIKNMVKICALKQQQWNEFEWRLKLIKKILNDCNRKQKEVIDENNGQILDVKMINKQLEIFKDIQSEMMTVENPMDYAMQVRHNIDHDNDNNLFFVDTEIAHELTSLNTNYRSNLISVKQYIEHLDNIHNIFKRLNSSLTMIENDFIVQQEFLKKIHILVENQKYTANVELVPVTTLRLQIEEIQSSYQQLEKKLIEYKNIHLKLQTMCREEQNIKQLFSCTSSKIRLDTLHSKLEALRQSIIIEQRNIDYFESDSKLINTLTITYNELKQQVTKNISH
ncbi:unnamed protein product, partial [Didymodactylos carnosus]